jgi:hypothetical protein
MCNPPCCFCVAAPRPNSSFQLCCMTKSCSSSHCFGQLKRMQDPMIRLHADVAAIMCAAAHNLANIVDAAATSQLSLARSTTRNNSGSRAPPAHIAPQSGQLSPIQLPEPSAATEHSEPAQAASSTAAEGDEQEPAASASLLSCLTLSLSGLQASVHIGPHDVLSLRASAHSSDCARSWMLPHIQVAMNGSAVFQGSELELSLSKVVHSAEVRRLVGSSLQLCCSVLSERGLHPVGLTLRAVRKPCTSPDRDCEPCRARRWR